MLLVLGVLLFLAFLVTSTISYLISRKSIRNAILEEELPLSGDNIYSEIQRDLFKPILISSLMANDTFVRDWILKGETDLEAISAYLQHIRNRYRTISSFLVSEKTRHYYEPQGILKTVREDDPRDIWFFRVRKMSADYEINVDPDQANRDTMTIFVNYRVLDKDGNFLGATGVGLAVNAVKALMQKYQSRFKRDIYFYDRSGKLMLNSLADSNEGLPVGSDHSAEAALQTVIDRVNRGETDVNLSDVRKSGAMDHYRYIPELDWILVVEQTSDGTRRILFQTFGVNLFICLLTAVILLSIIRIVVLRYQRNLEIRNHLLEENNKRIEKQAEELLEAKTKLDVMHHDKDEFIGVIVHDLKNPLGSVLGFSELLAQDQSLPEKPMEYAKHIYAGSRNMLEQVEGLLQLTELEAPNEVRLEKLDASGIVRQTVEDYAFQAQVKGISLILDLPDDSVPTRANESLLVSSIGNLISNAIKYSPVGARVRVSLVQYVKRVEISVRDEGEGISAEDQKQLFRKFERLRTRPTAGESSSGLGLYLVHQMVGRMGGTVRCESVPGEGSTFIIGLPTTQGAANSMPSGQ